MYISGIQERLSPGPTNRGLILFREVNEQNWTPEASAFFRSKTAGKTRQNRRKPSQKSVDVSGVQNRSFTSRKSIHLRFQHPQKMRAPTAPSFTKFNSARLTRTAESSRNRGAGHRALPLNEFRTNRRRQWRLRRESGLSEIERQGPAPGPSVPVYESDVLSNSLKSFGLPLPWLAFMHWPTRNPMTFWLPSRYCCA